MHSEGPDIDHFSLRILLGDRRIGMDERKVSLLSLPASGGRGRESNGGIAARAPKNCLSKKGKHRPCAGKDRRLKRKFDSSPER